MGIDNSSETSPNFPQDFTELSEGEISFIGSEGDLHITRRYRQIIDELTDRSKNDPNSEYYSFLLKNSQTGINYMSVFQTGTETAVPLNAIYSERFMLENLVLKELLHTHTKGNKYEEGVYSLISNTDLWNMRNRGIYRVWVIAPFFNNSLMCVQGGYDAAAPRDWLDAFGKFDQLFGDPEIGYGTLLRELTSLSSKLGVEVFTGKTTDSVLQKAT